jgi:tetratricopeptide (TPR) repeat protein
MTRFIVFSLFCVLLAAPTTAVAGDREARRFYDKALEKWDDPNPNLPVKYAEKALEHATNKTLRANILFILGRLHHSRTGNFEKAEANYQKVVTENIGVTDNTLKRIKADCFRNLGNLIYAERGDIKLALTKYRASHNTYATPETADTLSQFLYRIGRDPKKNMAARRKQLTASIKLAREAMDRNDKLPTRKPNETARFRLQLVIALTAAGETKEAKEVWEATKTEKLTRNSFYQRAQYMTLMKEDPAKIADVLHQTLDPRPTVKTRNDLRKFIRSEPDFQAFIQRKDWETLVKLEKEGATTPPTSRPSK